MTKDWYLDNLDKMLGYVHTLEGMVSDYQTNAKRDGYDTIAHLGWKITTSLGDIENLILESVSRLDSVKDNEIESFRKPIKSSLEDRLIPYLEEFEEGYSDALVDDPMDHYAGFDTTQYRVDSFYETFKNDHNLTDDDINSLESAVHEMWNEANNEITEHDMGEMYGVPRGATSEEALKIFESKGATLTSDQKSIIEQQVRDDFEGYGDEDDYADVAGFFMNELASDPYDEGWTPELKDAYVDYYFEYRNSLKKKPIESALRVVHREDKTFTAKDGTEYHLTLKRQEGKARRRGGWQDVAYTTVNCNEFPETEWFPYSEGKSASFSTSGETTKPNFWDVDNVATAMIRDYKGWSSGETDKTISEIMSSKKIRCSRGR